MADISAGDYEAFLDASKGSRTVLPHHDATIAGNAHDHVKGALKAHFDRGGAPIADTQVHAIVGDHIETLHGVRNGTIADPGPGYLTDRINGSHAGHETFLQERRDLVSQVGGRDAATVEAQTRSRDQRMRAAGQHAELDQLHAVERDMLAERGKNFKNLSPAHQQVHVDYLQNPNAIPQLQNEMRRGNSGGRSDPGRLGGRGGARAQAPVPVAGTDLMQHHDDTFTRVQNGRVEVVQEGWDHKNVVKEAQTNLKKQGSAYHDKAALKTARRAGPTPVAGTDRISFHDGTLMSVGADGQHTMVNEGWDAQHARKTVGVQNMADHTPPAPKPTSADKRAAKAAAHVTARTNMIEASLSSAPNQAHIDTARAHFNSAINYIETHPDATREQKRALSRMKPHHVDAVVHNYANLLGTGAAPAATALGQITGDLVHETHTSSLVPTFMKGRNVAANAVDSVAHAAGNINRAAVGDLLATDVVHNRATRALSTAGSAVVSSAHNGAVRATGAIATGASHVGGAIATAAPHVGTGIANTAKKGLGFAKGAGKAVLITGAVGAGLMAVTQMLKSPRPPRRMDDFVGGDMGSEPIVFNGGANVGMGTLSVPQVGQQAQMGNWAAQAPGMDQGVPSVPGR